MTVYIVTYDVSETATPCRKYCETFITLEQAKAYVQKESWNEDDYRCYEIVEKTLEWSPNFA